MKEIKAVSEDSKLEEMKANKESQSHKFEEIKASQEEIKINQVSQDQFEAKLEAIQANQEHKLEEMQACQNHKLADIKGQITEQDEKLDRVINEMKTEME